MRFCKDFDSLKIHLIFQFFRAIICIFCVVFVWVWAVKVAEQNRNRTLLMQSTTLGGYTITPSVFCQHFWFFGPRLLNQLDETSTTRAKNPDIHMNTRLHPNVSVCVCLSVCIYTRVSLCTDRILLVEDIISVLLIPLLLLLCKLSHLVCLHVGFALFRRSSVFWDPARP